jgi:hypothetical protein
MVATTKLASSKSKSPIIISGARVVGTSKVATPILVAGLGHSNSILAGGSGLRSWEHVPVVAITAKPVAVSRIAAAPTSNSLRNEVSSSMAWAGQSHGLGTPTTLGWVGSNNRRVPIKVMPPSLPRLTRQ